MKVIMRRKSGAPITPNPKIILNRVWQTPEEVIANRNTGCSHYDECLTDVEKEYIRNRLSYHYNWTFTCKDCENFDREEGEQEVALEKNYREKHREIKFRTCECGRKFRGYKDLCTPCRTKKYQAAYKPKRKYLYSSPYKEKGIGIAKLLRTKTGFGRDQNDY